MRNQLLILGRLAAPALAVSVPILAAESVKIDEIVGATTIPDEQT